MATRPNLVPENQPWVILNVGMEVCAERPSKRDCLEWVLNCRIKGNSTRYFIYGPDSCHDYAVVNKVAWEKTGG